MTFLREHSLAIAMFAIFAAALIGLAVTGWATYNNEEAEHGAPLISLGSYLTTPAFGEAVFENWESEFLQMGAYVALTALLVSRGSAESKDPDKREASDAEPRRANRPRRLPWPVRRGGMVLWLDEHSLTIALFALFVASFALHALTGAAEYSVEQAEHGAGAVSALAYVADPRFWFESFQNWQSEFLAVGILILLSIFLRERGSPQSKPIAASHDETGN